MTASPPRPLRQKTIGVLGGMSDVATADYYRLLNARLNAHHGGWDNAEIVLVSVNFGNIQHFVHGGLWDAARDYLADKVDRLEAAGVDVVICATNTMHRVVAPIMAERATPFIHIVDATGAAVRAAGLRRVGLLGTAATMRSADMAQRYAERFGVEVVVPPEADIVAVDRVVFDELVRRDIRPESKAEYLRVVEALRAAGAEGVILGCTEIFLLIGQEDLPGFPVFDTTALHVEAAVAHVVGGLEAPPAG
ncbi:amino acid racemase [Lichenibacterium minor]|uniref:Amino acid racemase n=1 Tax=Lichenibacterium minor TaxID=2316528 RepID=A0A4Q2UAY3_9HYPH|nr:amino acid racemase [Lichenibacterium minor]RYC33158.1 amino acid racemase [Lichenibacterium minor]